MSDQIEPPASSSSDDDATRQRAHLANAIWDAGSTSRLPHDEQASARLTEPRKARLTLRLGSAERASRRSRWMGRVGTFLATALVVTLISYLLVHLAPARSHLGDSPTVTPPFTALATATTVTTTDIATPASTATARAASGGSGTSNNSGGVNQPAGPAFAGLETLSASSNGDQAQSGPAFSLNTCGPTFTVDAAYTITLQPPATQMDYYVRHSDGTSDGSASQPLVMTFSPKPGDASGGTLDTAWTFPYTSAIGSPKWVELDILKPAPLTLREDFTALCMFSPQSPTLSVSPQGYDCAAGGNQTFTYTGNIRVYYAAGSHTVTYHWKRYDGSATPDQTVTFTQGVTSLPAQPDTMVVNSSVFPTAPWDSLMVTDQTGDVQGELLSPSICFPTPTPVG